jgi:hypothetical protein
VGDDERVAMLWGVWLLDCRVGYRLLAMTLSFIHTKDNPAYLIANSLRPV